MGGWEASFDMISVGGYTSSGVSVPRVWFASLAAFTLYGWSWRGGDGCGGGRGNDRVA